MAEGQEVPQARWENTIRASERIRRTYPQLYEEPVGEAPHGLFAGRRIIGRNTPINGGVYVGSGAREAIVVDDRQYPQELMQVSQQLSAALERHVAGSGKNIFSYVYEVTKVNLGGSQKPETIERLIEQDVARITGARGPDATVPLNLFIKNRRGVCRQRALLAGYLIEQLIQKGKLKGKVSVDRNTIPGLGGHAWARYESPDGKAVIIIDPSLEYVGPIAKAPKKVWDYNRPK